MSLTLCFSSKAAAAAVVAPNAESTAALELLQRELATLKQLTSELSKDKDEFIARHAKEKDELKEAKAREETLMEENRRMMKEKAQLQAEVIGYLKELRTKDEKVLGLTRTVGDHEFELEQLKVAYKCTAQFSTEQEAARQKLEERLSELVGAEEALSASQHSASLGTPGPLTAQASFSHPAAGAATHSNSGAVAANGGSSNTQLHTQLQLQLGSLQHHLSGLSGVSVATSRVASRVPSSNGYPGSPRLFGILGPTIGTMDLDGPLPFPPTPAPSVAATPGAMPVAVVRGRRMGSGNSRCSGSAAGGGSGGAAQQQGGGARGWSPEPNNAGGGAGGFTGYGGYSSARRALGSSSEGAGSMAAGMAPMGYPHQLPGDGTGLLLGFGSIGMPHNGQGFGESASYRSFDPQLDSNSTLGGLSNVHDLNGFGGDDPANAASLLMLPPPAVSAADLDDLSADQLKSECLRLRTANAALQRQVANLQKQNDLLQLRQLGAAPTAPSSSSSVFGSSQPGGAQAGPGGKRFYGGGFEPTFFGTVLTQGNGQQQGAGQQQQQQAQQVAGPAGVLGGLSRLPLATVPEEGSLHRYPSVTMDVPPMVIGNTVGRAGLTFSASKVMLPTLNLGGAGAAALNGFGRAARVSNSGGGTSNGASSSNGASNGTAAAASAPSPSVVSDRDPSPTLNVQQQPASAQSDLSGAASAIGGSSDTVSTQPPPPIDIMCSAELPTAAEQPGSQARASAPAATATATAEAGHEAQTSSLPQGQAAVSEGGVPPTTRNLQRASSSTSSASDATITPAAMPPPPPGIDAGLWELELLCAGAITLKSGPATSSKTVVSAPWWHQEQQQQHSQQHAAAPAGPGSAAASSPSPAAASAASDNVQARGHAGPSGNGSAGGGVGMSATSSVGGVGPSHASSSSGLGTGALHAPSRTVAGDAAGVAGAGPPDTAGTPDGGWVKGHGMWLPG